MAKLRIRGKSIDGITAVEICKIADGYLYLRLNMQDGVQQKIKTKLEPDSSTLFEVNGYVEAVQSENCVTIYGDVQKVTALNCCFVEGFIKNFPAAEEIKIDRKIKVCYGKEKRKRSALEHHIPYQEETFQVIQIEGNLTSFKDKTGLEIVIHGNVNTIDVGNCTEIKGNVEFVSARNRIFCTMGESKAKSTKELQKEYDDRAADLEASFKSLFGESSNYGNSEELKKINAFQ